jgi:hypothetical protein
VERLWYLRLECKRKGLDFRGSVIWEQGTGWGMTKPLAKGLQLPPRSFLGYSDFERWPFQLSLLNFDVGRLVVRGPVKRE